MKKKKEFLKELPDILRKSEKEIRTSVKSTLKEISECDEKEFLKSMIGKFLVVERNHIKCYYGEIKNVTSKLALDAENYNTKYRLKISAKKDEKIVDVTVDPVKKNYSLFNCECEAKKYLGKE